VLWWKWSQRGRAAGRSVFFHLPQDTNARLPLPDAAGFVIGCLTAYIGGMPHKPIELPPEVAKAFVRDMRAFFAAGHNTIKADGIAWAAAVPAQAALSGQAQAHRRERGIWALFLVGSSLE
jgi:hypothetical protein